VADWLLPAVAYAVFLAGLGITTKLALGGIAWPALILWAAAAYAVLGVGLVVIGGETLQFGAGAWWAAFSGALAVLGLVLFYLALGSGEVSRVVPVTAAYPVASVCFAAIMLSEHVDLKRILGTLLVVVGVIGLSRD
jgi:bacterial/archaeal transporter family protein